jgi:uncharacterized membrane protein YphA (DoxX/SURF4 family)
MFFEKSKEYAPAIVRISLALVFLWFSINQFLYVNDFVGLIPNFLVDSTGYSPAVFVMLNAFVEFVLGMFLLLGINVRFSSLVLGIHLFGIAFAVGYNAVMIRDLGLALATISVFLYGRDKLCIQKEDQ